MISPFSTHSARACAHTHTSTSLICSPLSPRFRREWSGELRKSESEIDKEKVKSCLIMSSSVAQKQYSKTQARWSVVYCPSSLKISKLTTAKQKHKREHLCVFYRFAGIAHPKMCKQYLQFFFYLFFLQSHIAVKHKFWTNVLLVSTRQQQWLIKTTIKVLHIRVLHLNTFCETSFTVWAFFFFVNKMHSFTCSIMK